MTATFDWNNFTSQLAKTIPSDQFRVYIEPLEFIDINENELLLAAENDLYIDLVPPLYGDKILKTLTELTGKDYQLRIEKRKKSTPIQPAINVALEPISEKKSEETSNPATDDFFSSDFIQKRSIEVNDQTRALSVGDLTKSSIRTLGQPLNPKYTFQTYVVGASNQFAHAAALAVAENPGRMYNPLFLYSNAGLGKTHLLHAIGNHILNTNPRAKICYISAEKFVNDLVESIKLGKQTAFRQKYRNGYDVLLMDDIQFIAGKPYSQEEFFFTFNALHSTDKHIVVASDKYPKDIPGLEDRLRSRFEWGLVVEVQIPDIETRLAILRTKAEESDIFLPNDVAMYLASNVKSNVRELEGALIRLGAKASLLGVEISLELARQDLKDIIKNPNESIEHTAVLEAVSKYFSIKISDLKSRDRSRKFALPRQIAMYLMRKYCSKSYADIGIILGGKDHSTIVHGDKLIKESLSTNAEIKRHIEEIQNALWVMQDYW